MKSHIYLVPTDGYELYELGPDLPPIPVFYTTVFPSTDEGSEGFTTRSGLVSIRLNRQIEEMKQARHEELSHVSDMLLLSPQIKVFRNYEDVFEKAGLLPEAELRAYLPTASHGTPYFAWGIFQELQYQIEEILGPNPQEAYKNVQLVAAKLTHPKLGEVMREFEGSIFEVLAKALYFLSTKLRKIDPNLNLTSENPTPEILSQFQNATRVAWAQESAHQAEPVQLKRVYPLTDEEAASQLERLAVIAAQKSAESGLEEKEEKNQRETRREFLVEAQRKLMGFRAFLQGDILGLVVKISSSSKPAGDSRELEEFSGIFEYLVDLEKLKEIHNETGELAKTVSALESPVKTNKEFFLAYLGLERGLHNFDESGGKTALATAVETIAALGQELASASLGQRESIMEGFLRRVQQEVQGEDNYWERQGSGAGSMLDVFTPPPKGSFIEWALTEDTETLRNQRVEKLRNLRDQIARLRSLPPRRQFNVVQAGLRGVSGRVSDLSSASVENLRTAIEAFETMKTELAIPKPAPITEFPEQIEEGRKFPAKEVPQDKATANLKEQPVRFKSATTDDPFLQSLTRANGRLETEGIIYQDTSGAQAVLPNEVAGNEAIQPDNKQTLLLLQSATVPNGVRIFDGVGLPKQAIPAGVQVKPVPDMTRENLQEIRAQDVLFVDASVYVVDQVLPLLPAGVRPLIVRIPKAQVAKLSVTGVEGLIREAEQLHKYGRFLDVEGVLRYESLEIAVLPSAA